MKVDSNITDATGDGSLFFFIIIAQKSLSICYTYHVIYGKMKKMLHTGNLVAWHTKERKNNL